MTLISKYTVILFGIFLFGAGLMMLLNPVKAREVLRRAGSTNLINYSEITLRMIPAAALVLYAELSKFPELFKGLGWFMIATSLILYVVPRRIHHGYAVKCADILTPTRMRLISPFSMLFGSGIIYSVI